MSPGATSVAVGAVLAAVIGGLAAGSLPGIWLAHLWPHAPPRIVPYEDRRDVLALATAPSFAG